MHSQLVKGRIFDAEHTEMNNYSIACYQTIPDKLSTIETTMYSPVQGVTFSYQVFKIFIVSKT